MSWERQVCIKSAEEIKMLREAGIINAEALKAAAEACVPGASTWDVNAAADAVLNKYHVVSAFKGVPGPIPYPASTCVSVNNILVHGIPSKNIVLKEGDIVSIDCGATLRGYVADSAGTYRLPFRHLPKAAGFISQSSTPDTVWAEVCGKHRRSRITGSRGPD